MKPIELWQGDCLELMKNIPDGSVDLVLTDPPYGTTACKWDSVIPFEPMWEELKRIVKRGGAIILFGSEPFSSLLRASNIDWYKYDWIWEKPNGSGFLSAKKTPLKNHENISVFFQAPTDDTTNAFYSLKEYFQSEKKKSGLTSKQIQELLGNYMLSHYFTSGTQFAIPNQEDYKKLQSTGFWTKDYEEIKAEYESAFNTYNPQFTEGKPYQCKQGRLAEVVTGTSTGKSTHITKSDGKRYPKTVLKFNKETGSHPTQKPIALLEYLIRTYTNDGETVLDFTMGSGSTGVACVNTGRKFIGIELDEGYFNIAKKRIEEAYAD